MTGHFSIIFLSSFVFGLLGAYCVSVWGSKMGLVDVPNNRSSHYKPTPKGGGVGILAAFLFASIITDISIGLYLPAAGIAILSLAGDRRELSQAFRLVIQFAAAIAFLSACSTFGGDWKWVLLLPGAVFMVGTANFYNFMDGINGIAGVTGAAGFGLLAFALYLSGAQADGWIMSAALAVSCIGFLPFNLRNRARVFMGDVGAVLLGFVFAGLVLSNSENLTDFLTYVSFLFPFYADELTTMAIRIKNGERLTKAHRSHVYQFLANELGMRHWKVSVGFGCMQLLVGLTTLAVKPHGLVAVLSVLLLYSMLFIVFGYKIRVKAAGMKAA